MPDNLYLNEAEHVPTAGLGDLLLPIATEFAHSRTTRAILGGRRVKRYRSNYSRLGAWWRGNRRANREASMIWRGFMRGGEGIDLAGRYASAERAAGRQIVSRISARPSFFRRPKFSAFGKGRGITRGLANPVVKRAITTRTIAGLARVPLGVANAYFWVGSMLPDIASMGMAGLSEMAKFGASLRAGTPETSSQLMDMATRQRAFTMRHASEMALHMSATGTRAALGNEANFLHS